MLFRYQPIAKWSVFGLTGHLSQLIRIVCGRVSGYNVAKTPTLEGFGEKKESQLCFCGLFGKGLQAEQTVIHRRFRCRGITELTQLRQ